MNRKIVCTKLQTNSQVVLLDIDVMTEKPKVIVIDDEPTNLDVFCEFLELNDINVIARGNDGFEAVQLFERHNPDIVLLDVAMPNYDGYFALRGIIALNKNAKVVMITALEDSKMREELLGLGAREVLRKPFELNGVIEIIDEIMEREKIIPNR